MTCTGPGRDDAQAIGALVAPARGLPHRLSDDVTPDAVGEPPKLGELRLEQLATNLDFPEGGFF